MISRRFLLSFFCLIWGFSLSSSLFSDEFGPGSHIGFGGLSTNTSYPSGFSPVFSSFRLPAGGLSSDEMASFLLVRGVRFGVADSGFSSDPASTLAEGESVLDPAVIYGPFVYPNPFRLDSERPAKLYYRLSKDMDVEYRVYDMLARLVYKTVFFSSQVGGMGAGQPNRPPVFDDGFVSSAKSRLSSGVFFYYLMHEGKVLAKGKFVVKP